MPLIFCLSDFSSLSLFVVGGGGGRVSGWRPCQPRHWAVAVQWSRGRRGINATTAAHSRWQQRRRGRNSGSSRRRGAQQTAGHVIARDRQGGCEGCGIRLCLKDLSCGVSPVCCTMFQSACPLVARIVWASVLLCPSCLVPVAWAR